MNAVPVARLRVVHDGGRVDQAGVERAAAELLLALGRDPESPQLADTPRRVASAYAELLTPREFDLTTFSNDEGYDELVLARGIPVHSLCEHHLLPFPTGRRRRHRGRERHRVRPGELRRRAVLLLRPVRHRPRVRRTHPPGASTELVLRGDPADSAFVAFWLTEGRVLAGMQVNVWDTIDDFKTLIASRATVDPHHLADPRHPLLGSVPTP